MIEKINGEQRQRFVEKGEQNKTPVSNTRPNEGPDATLQADFGALLEKVKNIPDDSAAVEKARQLLNSGQLDSPENLRQAAENILKQGV